jgi:hypothetical protein
MSAAQTSAPIQSRAAITRDSRYSVLRARGVGLAAAVTRVLMALRVHRCANRGARAVDRLRLRWRLRLWSRLRQGVPYGSPGGSSALSIALFALRPFLTVGPVIGHDFRRPRLLTGQHVGGERRLDAGFLHVPVALTVGHIVGRAATEAAVNVGRRVAASTRDQRDHESGFSSHPPMLPPTRSTSKEQAF